ncbi:J domain-containing protein [Desulfosediminicola ganghwensis]|uniref:J domain-containing protein n=1 Tax=Desulfosediminicola ganghwensis TaxID=2569540 RepID=UPI0010AC9E88|nr:DnaJ domain-containing protein [Desulfosediminicola ganghwensis]
MKDYYQILEVTPEFTDDEIRKRYRKLAMQYHPDRNPNNPGAEERFKEVAEAYGVLTDPAKRKQYDMARKMGGTFSPNGNGQAGGFNYSQEDILRDLFKDPRFQQMFNGLLQEFARKGFRSNQQFVNKSFFGGRGGMFIGGIFMIGSIAGPAIMREAKKKLPTKKSIMRSIGHAVGSLLGGSKQKAKEPEQVSHHPPQLDMTYTVNLSSAELRDGKTLDMITMGPNGQEKLRIKVPAGSKAGQKLRIRGKGFADSGGRGDLFVKLAER